MECRDVQRLIDAWWDRELDVRTSSEIEAHVAACPACGRSYGTVNTLLTKPQPVVVPDGLRDRVLEAVMAVSPAGRKHRTARSREQRATRNVVLPGAWIGAIAACLVLVATGLITLQTMHGPGAPGPKPPSPVAMVKPMPSVIAPLAQLMVMGTSFNPAPALAQAIALQQIVEPECRVTAEKPKHTYIRETPSADPSPVMPEISVIVTGISLGA